MQLSHHAKIFDAQTKQHKPKLYTMAHVTRRRHTWVTHLRISVPAVNRVVV